MKLPLMRAVLGVLALAGIVKPAPEEWSGWRAPRRDGTSMETGFPVKWSATENVVWKVSIPGKGHSSPVVWGDRIFLTTCVIDTGERKLLCLDRKDGRVLWDRVIVKSDLEHKHDLNSFASSTPVTDGKHLWFAFFDNPRFTVFCYDLDG